MNNDTAAIPDGGLGVALIVVIAIETLVLIFAATPHYEMVAKYEKNVTISYTDEGTLFSPYYIYDTNGTKYDIQTNGFGSGYRNYNIATANIGKEVVLDIEEWRHGGTTTYTVRDVVALSPPNPTKCECKCNCCNCNDGVIK